jgi:hypothetical protein
MIAKDLSCEMVCSKSFLCKKTRESLLSILTRQTDPELIIATDLESLQSTDPTQQI